MKDEVELVTRTKIFALSVVKLFVSLPKTTEGQVLGKQLLRSGTSVGANYREAQRARSKAEHRSHGMALGSLQFLQPSGERSGGRPRQFIAKIGDCLKELDETAYWFELLTESGIVRAPRLAQLQDECNQHLAIFTTISKKAKSNPS
jgi:hypothetical protein